MQTKQNNLLLAEFEYSPAQVERGYTNQTLYVNLSDNTIAARPVSDTMKDIFIGGRGFGLWLLWQGIKDGTKWDDPENELVISSGPIGGITNTRPPANRWWSAFRPPPSPWWIATWAAILVPISSLPDGMPSRSRVRPRRKSSRMTAAELKEIHLDHTPAANLQQAVDDALGSYQGGGLIAVMPYAGLVLPKLTSRDMGNDQ